MSFVYNGVLEIGHGLQYAQDIFQRIALTEFPSNRNVYIYRLVYLQLYALP